MIAKVYTAIPQGYDGRIVEVEGDTNRGLPVFNIVGMANKTVTESRERVRSALSNSGFDFPQRKVTISLAPAELAKDGSHLDLPIALAILVLSQQLLPENVVDRLFVGEVALDGVLRPVRGIINIIEAAKQAGYSEIFIPKENLPQASLVEGVKVYGVASLIDLFLHLKGQRPIPLQPPQTSRIIPTDDKYPSLDDVRGQAFAKRALTISLAGHHNLLLTGPPGVGKTLLAQIAARLLPEPTPIERVAIAKIHSLSYGESGIPDGRPFRSPHHTASSTAIIGGGTHIAPGEISLAHGGILFLDEFPEYSRNVIEALRQPLENGEITISRAEEHVTYPANFMLIATMNPCPCGNFGDPHRQCTCTPHQLASYQKRLSGPIRDRIDLIVNLDRVEVHDLMPADNVVKNNKIDPNTYSEHDVVKNNITEARQRQIERYKTPGKFNSSLTSAEATQLIQLSPAAHSLLRQAVDRLKLSTRSYYKVLKVAQTIADLDKITEVGIEQISEALTYRDHTNEH